METKAFTLSECRSAVAACDRLISQADSRALAAYWQGVQDMWKARERETERASLRGPEPCLVGYYKYGQDEYRCPKCGLIWGTDEPRPECLRML